MAGTALLARCTAREFWKDRVLGLSAEAAFWQLLSLPAMLLALMGTIGYFTPQFGADNVAKVESTILDAAEAAISARAVTELVQPAVHSVLTDGRADVVSVSFLIALWTGSSAMSTFVNTITIAYNLREHRSAVRSRLLALWLFLGGVAVSVVVLPALVLGPDLISRFTPAVFRSTVHAVAVAAYWPLAVVGALASLMTLYHLALPVRPPWHRGFAGAVLALCVWLLGSYGLRAWAAYVAAEDSPYRSMSAPIVVLVFFYVIGLGILLGAELNAESDRLWPSPETAGARAQRRPSGSRLVQAAYRTADRARRS